MKEKELLKTIVKKCQSNFWKIIKYQHPNLFSAIVLIEGNSFSEKVYKFINDIKETEKCEFCGDNPKKFLSINNGYSKVCCRTCNSKLHLKSAIEVANGEEAREKRKNTLLEKYGVEYSTDLESARVNRTKYFDSNGYPFQKESTMKRINEEKRKKFFQSLMDGTRISPDYIPLFDEVPYEGINKKLKFQCKKCNGKFYSHISWNMEPRCKICNPMEKWQSVTFDNVKEYYNDEILVNHRGVLPNKLELDFFFPNDNKAIELNGNYWHSTKVNKDKEYHYKKFKLCEDIGIKLIQFYEFEWIESKESVLIQIKDFLENNLYVPTTNVIPVEKLYLYKTVPSKLLYSQPKEIFLEGNLPVDYKTEKSIFNAGYFEISSNS